jgi:hypothetical protein
MQAVTPRLTRKSAQRPSFAAVTTERHVVFPPVGRKTQQSARAVHAGPI